MRNEKRRAGRNMGESPTDHRLLNLTSVDALPLLLLLWPDNANNGGGKGLWRGDRRGCGGLNRGLYNVFLGVRSLSTTSLFQSTSISSTVAFSFPLPLPSRHSARTRIGLYSGKELSVGRWALVKRRCVNRPVEISFKSCSCQREMF